MLLWANRNGFFYVLDRTNGKFLSGWPFIKVNWASGLDEATGRPILTPHPPVPQRIPADRGARTGTLRPTVRIPGSSTFPPGKDYGAIFQGVPVEYKEGQHFGGGIITAPIPGGQIPNSRAGPNNTDTDAAGHGAVIALIPIPGKRNGRLICMMSTPVGF